ncbi:LysR substrate-binding domain-containing protein [Gammaproteobacteria bacterium]|nr:LysR substrate-binding domain-containing protein [Gammaproteobacteria bacterium]
MDVNWLMDFVCLCRTLNFSRAAEERNITQSAFSRRIQSLESWVGVALVDRGHYPIQLTPAGRQFYVTARESLGLLIDSRQSIRTAERGKPLQRFAALHTISVNYLQQRVSEFEKTMPTLRTRVISDTTAACCQLLSDGGCDFLLCYRHQHNQPTLDETRFVSKDVAIETLIPVAQREAIERHGWSLDSLTDESIPYLSYDPESFLGRIVDRIIGERKSLLDTRYMDALAEALKRRAQAGSGMAWLPEFAIADELARGDLVQIGGSCWVATLTISLVCSLERLDAAGRDLWDAF